jgi:carboxyl-terminal processing protease
MKNKRGTYLPLLFALVLMAGIFIGSLINKGQVQERLLIYPRTDKINNILNYIEDKYVDSVSKKEITENVIPKIIENLDPHSVYIPAKDLQRFNEPLIGNFSGIGVQFNNINDTVIIIRTIPNGPSEKVGVMAGDRIVKVNGERISGVNMPTDSIVAKLRGPKSSQVNITVFRRIENDTIDFDIIRDDIPLYSLDIRYMITDSIGYIKLSKFSSTTFEEYSEAYLELKNMGMQKLILDLRGNGGGYLNLAIQIADQFLEDKKLIVYTEGRNSPRKNYYATSQGMSLDIDVAVLIDEFSASASEILAGALQDNDRGLIIGRRSFGKGLVQDHTEFNDGSALRLTIARYYTPTGRCIQKPYENGNEAYYLDIHQRLEHGEFFTEDSIVFADSLKYTTPLGKEVYGGGGIMPDIFVPADSLELNSYYAKVKNRGLIYRFTFDYADQHRSLLNKNSESLEQLMAYIDRQDIIREFVAYARSKGIEASRKEIRASEHMLETSLKAEIAQKIFDNAGFYPIIHQIDKTLQIAIEEISAM